jgi:hypothetical protein
MMAAAWLHSAIMEPLIFFVLLVLGLSASLYLFVTLKIEIQRTARLRSQDRLHVQTLENALGDARVQVERLTRNLHDVEAQTGMLVAPAAPKSGMNLSKRTQVLRLHRAGQDAGGIAAALGLQRAEVDLLIKVHRLLLENV